MAVTGLLMIGFVVVSANHSDQRDDGDQWKYFAGIYHFSSAAFYRPDGGSFLCQHGNGGGRDNDARCLSDGGDRLLEAVDQYLLCGGDGVAFFASAARGGQRLADLWGEGSESGAADRNRLLGISRPPVSGI